MIPNKTTDEYTRYCITPEGKEYLRRMLEDSASDTNEKDDNEFELNMNEEIDFENLKIFDEDDDEDFEPDEDEILDNDIMSDEFFRLNEEPNDDAYDFWKETRD